MHLPSLIPRPHGRREKWPGYEASISLMLGKNLRYKTTKKQTNNQVKWSLIKEPDHFQLLLHLLVYMSISIPFPSIYIHIIVVHLFSIPVLICTHCSHSILASCVVSLFHSLVCMSSFHSRRVGMSEWRVFCCRTTLQWMLVVT